MSTRREFITLLGGAATVPSLLRLVPCLADASQCWQHGIKHRRQEWEDRWTHRKSLNVNGTGVRIPIDDPVMPLLYALRDNLALHGPRFGRGLAQCGACTVHVDGKAVRSCVTPLSSLTAQQKVVTLEGLGTPQRLHPVQRGFIEALAVQCG